MMYSDDEIKDIPGGSYMRPGDELISIREVCLRDKLDRKDLGIHLFPDSSRNDLDVRRSMFRDSFFPESLEQQARFAWTEEDGNIASLVSEPGFGTTGQTTFGRQIDAALKSDMKESDTSSSAMPSTSRRISNNSVSDSQLVTSTSSGNTTLGFERGKNTQGTCKVDKADPRSRYHFVKYVKRHGRTVRLWECGICGREFQHQYTLMRHLPTHTDERNFHCVACGKSFRQLSTLSQHRAIHSAERPYACEVCNKTFNRVSTLISHRKTHSEDKPYRCHLCPKGFHQKGNLRNHLFTHTNERPYRCNICYKGFNQQSNLVCHKNKAHPEDGTTVLRRNNVQSVPRPLPEPNAEPRPECEVSSSVEPYSPTPENPTSPKFPWNLMDPIDPWSNGVIVDPIKTYHMEVALATKQTPFALLKPDKGDPVLVKVVDTSIPGGKQMLVPATADDLRIGGKIIVKKEDESQESEIEEACATIDGPVQIRVPVVATVVPRINPEGRLHLAVEEPHRAFHTALSHDVETKIETCIDTIKKEPVPSTYQDLRYTELNTSFNRDSNSLSGMSSSSSSCEMPPSFPLDLIPMDLFETMECMPLGPQITAVDTIDQSPASDDSDIFIGKFEESIQLSDSE